MAAKTSSSSSSSKTRRTKAEVQQSLDNIIEDVVKEKESVTPKSLELAKWQEIELKESIKDISVDSITRDIANLNSEVTRTLGTVSEKLVSQVELLSKFQQAVELEGKQLQNLYKKDIVATSLDILIQEYESKKLELDEAIEKQKSDWEAIQEQKEFESKESESFLKKSRQRENDEHEYALDLKRKKEQDEYEEKIRLRDRTNLEKQQQLEKNWKEREESLKARETELASLKKEVEQFNQKLDAEKQKAVAEALKEMEQKQEHFLTITRKDAESEKRVYELKIQLLEEKVIQQIQQITALQGELALAKKQVQEIAEKAIEGASGAKTLAHINQIAMEQAKTRNMQS